MSDKFIAVKDGNCWFFALPDFVDLQTSAVLFLPVYDIDMNYIFDLLQKQLKFE